VSTFEQADASAQEIADHYANDPRIMSVGVAQDPNEQYVVIVNLYPDAIPPKLPFRVHGVVVRTAKRTVPTTISGASKPKKWTEADTQKVAAKWGPIFGVPTETVMSIVKIESDHNPKKINMKRLTKGGAWGLGQQMYDEADDKTLRITHEYGKKHPEVKTTAKKWHRKPEDLLDPDLNLMLTSWQLGKLHQEFGDFPTVAAAYHQGQGAIRRRLRAGLPPVSPRLQPLGASYVRQAMNAMATYHVLSVGVSQPQFEIPNFFTIRG
jgi:soluble lytic murein transglycosylase-like protein